MFIIIIMIGVKSMFVFSVSHRQAQAAVLEGIPRLHKLNIPTKRPDDYFAEMVKTDEHMKKVMCVLSV